MRNLAIGDIHGCLKALETLVDFVDPKPEDTLITLGDYIDRGPQSKGVIEYLIELRKSHKLIALKGNHEAMMEDARTNDEDLMNWLLNGGIETLTSFCAVEFAQIPSSCWEFFQSCQDYYETNDHIFVHAGLIPDMTLDEQPGEALYWLRFFDTEHHMSGKTIICGHTPQRNGKPTAEEHAICIDTWACNKGWLTCLDVESGRYWQANQKGKTRKGKL
ncbi:serine/threonine protein phosphatase [Verrucomicrobiaceae bacterium N1E253]|uniref:Serine/threonine protein phosphatase n=1 Tax=Oceaniferula marina TaxID=2748318 RepID=A0A851GF72_9BACT|nr:metallophosphoesterase family protein [Oceaniferula marina]NWK56066.1 serine/threonine protein phosphatase [Oceaniferula marina]